MTWRSGFLSLACIVVGFLIASFYYTPKLDELTRIKVEQKETQSALERMHQDSLDRRADTIIKHARRYERASRHQQAVDSVKKSHSWLWRITHTVK